MNPIRLKYNSLMTITLLVVLSINGCSKSEASIIDETNTDTISLSAKINGVNFKIPNLEEFVGANISLLSEQYIITITGFDIQEGTDFPKNITLVMIGENFGDLKAGIVFNTIAADITSEGAGAGYSKSTENGREKAIFEFDDMTEIAIELTLFDRDKKLISGEFNFKGFDAETNNFYTVTDGIFTNLPYTIKER